MEITDAVKILEMLAAGCSPATGELVEDGHILNQRDVIRALQIAIDLLKKGSSTDSASIIGPGVRIEEEDIRAAIQLFLEHDNTPTENRLTSFFLASRSFMDTAIVSHNLYGKYKRQYTKGQLQDFFSDYLYKKGYVSQGGRQEHAPWKDIDYFQKAPFNNLTETTINHLKSEVNKLGVKKNDELAGYQVLARKKYSRAYEPWSETEKQLLDNAFMQTNDVRVLAACFQRGEGAIISCGKKIIFDRNKGSL